MNMGKDMGRILIGIGISGIGTGQIGLGTLFHTKLFMFLSRKYKDFTLIRVNMEVHELVYEKYREINEGHIGGFQAEFTLLFGSQLGLRFDLWTLGYMISFFCKTYETLSNQSIHGGHRFGGIDERFRGHAYGPSRERLG